jgi:hypothetical protein
VEWSYQHAATAGIYFLEQRLATTLSLLKRRYFHDQEASCFHFTHNSLSKQLNEARPSFHAAKHAPSFLFLEVEDTLVASRMDMFIHQQHRAVSRHSSC